MERLIFIILGLIIFAAGVYFSSLLWESHRILSIIIALAGGSLGVKVMMI
jgi:hypothetical protein